jgi:CRP-like cAMP-binding protein
MAPFLRFLELFQPIPEADKTLISTQLEQRSLSAGEVLLPAGKVARNLHFITEGILKIVKVNEKGREVTQFFLKELQFCTILQSFDNGTPAEEGIAAACDTQLLVISRDKLLALYAQLPYLEPLISGVMHRALLDKIQIRNTYMGEDATTRYRQFISRQPDIALRVPLSDIASYLGITQQSLSRIRRNIR